MAGLRYFIMVETVLSKSVGIFNANVFPKRPSILLILLRSRNTGKVVLQNELILSRVEMGEFLLTLHITFQLFVVYFGPIWTYEIPFPIFFFSWFFNT